MEQSLKQGRADNMNFVIGYFGLQIVGFLILLWISWRFFDRRYRSKEDPNQLPGSDFIRTSEICIDSKDGIKYQVYYNPATGERKYIRVGK
ncbi:HD family phosphohydrolase [Paenibacillus sediminis]|uniref:HD family phosphohydrolase n=1 Tax=Paenibacillus sediminis TaxID=664909 RepID=A0ABS4H4Q2_9BACL|nr:HD family phosphohydrolase [Paenibacillus sediminis]MBP1937509.1 hypothetical protein [Paenibacillus sediminis]